MEPHVLIAALKIWTRWAFAYVVGAIALIVVFAMLLSLLPFGRDATDGEWPHRSGMTLYTDAETGCQYLSAAGNGIAPRLTAYGEHAGCRK